MIEPHKKGGRIRKWEKQPAPKEARIERAQDLMDARMMVRRLTQELREASEHLSNLRESPLPTSVKCTVMVYPGEPGYEDLPASYGMRDYVGEFAWIALP